MNVYFGRRSIAEAGSTVFSKVSARQARKGTKGAIAMAAMAGSFAVVACGANGSTESTEKTSSASEGLHEVSCTTVTPNVTTFASSYSNTNITGSYGSTGCPAQFVVRMNNFVPGFAAGVSAKVSPASPVSQALCPDTEASIDLYVSNDGTNWTIAGSVSSYGTWYPGSSGPGFGNPAGCYYGQGIMGLQEQTGLYTDYLVVGSMLQHPANKSQTYDSQLPMSMQIGGVYPPR